MYHYFYLSQYDDTDDDDYLDEQIPPVPIEELPLGLIADEM